jgi:hypothetical protein
MDLHNHDPLAGKLELNLKSIISNSVTRAAQWPHPAPDHENSSKKQALPCAPAPPFLYGKMDVSQAKIVAQTHIARESQREREKTSAAK